MKILKKFIPYLIYLCVLLAVIVVSAVVINWTLISQLIFATLGVSVCILLMLFLIAAMITLH